MNKPIVKCAPAKINLSLRILAKRPDGYHELETLFLSVGLFDDLSVQLLPEHKINVMIAGNQSLSDSKNNLCYKAAAVFASYYPAFSGCRIHLDKHIPIGAGLGGGSSDAAATLTALNELCGNPLSHAMLRKLAMQLGADVPFFLQSGLAIGRGIGEQLEYVDKKWDFHILILCPTQRISTRWAYLNFKMRLTNKKKYVILKSLFLKRMQVSDFYKFFVNDFEELVFSHYPLLRELKKDIYQMGAVFAGLSGSGSAMFGLFESYDDALEANHYFSKKFNCILVEPVYTHNP